MSTTLTARYGRAYPRNPAFEARYLVMYALPAWLLPHFPRCGGKSVTRIYMHRDVVAPFEAVMRELVDTGLIKELKTYEGCYNPRLQRGSSAVSIHSWALAFDFNAATNPLGGRVTFTQRFLAVWRRHGFTCGADWKMPRTDGMHFEYTK